MTETAGMEAAVARHFTILVYPFRHATGGKGRPERLARLRGRWRPWWQRLDAGALPAAIDDTYFFLPYIRELLFPEAAHKPPGTPSAEEATRLANLTLDDLAREVDPDAVLRMTCAAECREQLRRASLEFERRDEAGKVVERFRAPFEVCWGDVALFPHGIGYLLLKVELREEAPAVGRLNTFRSLLRAVHAPTLGWQMASWRLPRPEGELICTARDLVDFLLQGLTAVPDRGLGTLDKWLLDLAAYPSAPRDSATPFGHVFGQSFHLFTYACLAGSAPAVEGRPADGRLFASASEQALYELATCTDTARRSYAPHRRFVEGLWERNLAAFWENWQALVLHDNVVFLGLGADGFTVGALPHNVESDYFPLYLYALFQKTWLSVKFGELVRPQVQLGRNLKAARQLWDDFLLFQNHYWFAEVTRKPLATELYRRFRQGLGVEPLYRELAEQARDLQQYHEGKSQRRRHRLQVSAYFVYVPLAAMAALFGMRLIRENLWLTALVMVAAMYALVAGLWYLWNRFDRE